MWLCAVCHTLNHRNTKSRCSLTPQRMLHSLSVRFSALFQLQMSVDHPLFIITASHPPPAAPSVDGGVRKGWEECV